MTRAQHTQHSLPSYPVYCSAFISENELVLGGGGGSSKSGIKNMLRLYKVSGNRDINLTDQFELASGEDAPMSMAVNLESRKIICGVNSSEDKLAKGENQNCRVFSVKDNKVTFVKSKGTLPADDAEDYQRVTILSPNGSLLAVGGSHDFTVLEFPSLRPISSSIQACRDRALIYDAAFSLDNSRLVVATNDSMLVYSISEESDKGKEKESSRVSLVKTIPIPSFPGGAKGSFRAVKFHPTDSNVLYTVVNTSAPPPNPRKSKAPIRHAFIYKWDPSTWEQTCERKLDKSISAFDISPDGRFLSFGTSDNAIGVLDSKSLSPLLSILKAHEFPIMTMRFNPTSKILVTGSSDNSIRVISIPESLVGATWSTVIMILFAILVVILSIIVSVYFQE